MISTLARLTTAGLIAKITSEVVGGAAREADREGSAQARLEPSDWWDEYQATIPHEWGAENSSAFE